MALKITIPSGMSASGIGTVKIDEGAGWEVDSHGYLTVENEAGKWVAAFHRDHWHDVQVVEGDA